MYFFQNVLLSPFLTGLRENISAENSVGLFLKSATLKETTRISGLLSKMRSQQTQLNAFSLLVSYDHILITAKTDHSISSSNFKEQRIKRYYGSI